MSFVMKTTNFVKSVETSFVAPLTPKCTRVLRTTPWQAKPKQHNSTHGTGPLLETLSYYFVALLSHKDGQELRVCCSYWWDVTFIVMGSSLFIWSSGTDVLRQANANCHFCLSAKCVMTFFLVLLFRIIWSNSDSNLCHFDILNSFKLLKDRISHT